MYKTNSDELRIARNLNIVSLLKQAVYQEKKRIESVQVSVSEVFKFQKNRKNW